MPSLITASSKTPGGLDSEETLHEIDPASGIYNCKVDLNNLAVGDSIILRLYDQVADGTYRLNRIATYANAQGTLVAEFLPADIIYAIKWTIEQKSGSVRAFPFVVTKLG